MTKSGGMGDQLYIGGYDLSNDIGSLRRIGGGNTPLPKTGIDKSAMERMGGKRDGGIEYQAYYNPATDRAHDVLSALPTTDQVVTYCRGTTLGNPAAAVVSKQPDYAGNRGEDGSFLLDVQALANAYGLEWGVQLTAGQRTDGSATNGTGVDFGTGSTAFGLQAYLHVFAFTGTSVTIKLQESSDNGAGDAFTDVTGGAFAVVSAARTAERIQTSRTLTVERYLRVVTTGTFSACTFAVMCNRNDTSVSF